MVIAAALRDEFDVVVVSSGAEALDRAQVGDIDLLLLDVMMPDLTGFEVCRRLNNDGPCAMPIVFVTSLEETADEAQGFAVGGVDYIAKPIRPAILRARVLYAYRIEAVARCARAVGGGRSVDRHRQSPRF